MRVIRTVKALQSWRRQQDASEARIGFVPTMGALHSGHRSLIQRARRSTDRVIVSVFVNPLQFGPKEDFQRYPRFIKGDIACCRRESVDVLFVPSLTALYPLDFQTSITVGQLSQHWEGEQRPMHFRGVATIVTKLLNLVRPEVVCFGQKDYQQFLVIKQLVKDLHMNVKVVMCPTTRELDGLACSSRNQHLSASQRQHAPVLHRALLMGRNAIQNGWTSTAKIQNLMRRQIINNSSASIDYLNICHVQTLEPLNHVNGRVVILAAIRLGKVRLLDNVLVKCPHE